MAERIPAKPAPALAGAEAAREAPVREASIDRAQLPPRAEDWLRQLGDSTLLHLPGRYRGRTRAVTTLIHGNEPSGLRAVHGWLRSGAEPATDVVFWIASVRAALGPPLFAHRALPAEEDLNRCFGDAADAVAPAPTATPTRARAARALARLRHCAPEALIDLHNNTGHNPPYAVGSHPGPLERGIAALFGRWFVHSELALGALVEATQAFCPSLTIECGRAGDPAADATARRGLERFLEQPDLEALRPARSGRDVGLLVDPMRVCVREGVSLAIAPAPQPGAGLTVADALDRHNFERLAPGTLLGWVRDPAGWPLRVEDAHGRDRSREWFALRGGRLETRRELLPIMMTNDPQIAVSDCLFYIVQRG